MYVWVDVSCLPNNASPADGLEATSKSSKGQAVAEAVAFSDSELVQTESQVRRGGRGGAACAVNASEGVVLVVDGQVTFGNVRVSCEGRALNARLSALGVM